MPAIRRSRLPALGCLFLLFSRPLAAAVDPEDADLQQLGDLVLPPEKSPSALNADGTAAAPPMLSMVGAPAAPPAPKPENCDCNGIEIKEECPMSVSGFDWELYAEELYRARSLIFSGNVEGAKQYTLNLLTHITSKFYTAFECPLAAASTYWTLATILMFEGKRRRALNMLQMGFIFVRDRGFHECTPWPIQGWDMMMAGRNLVAEVQKLDRPAILMDSTPKGFRYANTKMAIVTICSYAPDEAVRQVSIENHGLYAKLHGYDLHMFLSPEEIRPNTKSRMNVKDGKHKPFFWKVNAVKNVFDGDFGPPPDWVLWADCDALFMDPERTIDSVIHMYTGNYSHPIVAPKDHSVKAELDNTDCE